MYMNIINHEGQNMALTFIVKGQAHSASLLKGLQGEMSRSE